MAWGFWEIIIALFGTALAGILVISIIPVISSSFYSLLNVLGQFASAVFSFFRQVGQFVVDHLPKPLKLLLFLALFGFLSVGIYNFTVGATKICNPEDNKVYDIPFVAGAAIQFYPGNLMDKLVNPDAIGLSDSDQEILATMQNVTAKDFDIRYFDVNNTNGPVLIEVDRVVGTRTYSQLVSFLVPGGSYLDVLGTPAFFSKSNYDVVKDWLGGPGNSVTYDICMDWRFFGADTKTCVLQDTAFIARCEAPYKQLVGNIIYSWKEDNILVVEFNPDVVSGINFLTPDASDCREYSGSVDQELLIEEFGSNNGYALYDVLSVPPLVVDLIPYSTGWQEIDPMTFSLYGSVYGAVLKGTYDGEDYVFVNKSLQPEDPTKQRYFQSVSVQEIFMQSGATERNEGRYDLVKYYCKKESEDPFDSKMLVAGIDVFNPKMMLWFVLIGAVLSFYAWYKRIIE